MAAPGPSDEDSVFELLRQADPAELERRHAAISRRLETTFQLSQQRVAELIDQNSTLPTTVSSVTILGSPNTRHGFLRRVVEPLLSANRDRPYTQSELIHEVSKTAGKLRKFGVCDYGACGALSHNLQASTMSPSPFISTNPRRPTLAPHLPMLLSTTP